MNIVKKIIVSLVVIIFSKEMAISKEYSETYFENSVLYEDYYCSSKFYKDNSVFNCKQYSVRSHFDSVCSYLSSGNHECIAQNTNIEQELRKSDNVKNELFVSPEKAYYMSFIPVWSGSWNAEFNLHGLLYQPVKLYGATFLLLGIFLFSVGVYGIFAGWDGEGTGSTLGYGSIGIGVGGSIYVGFSTLDAQYSEDYVEQYNIRNRNANFRSNHDSNGTIFRPFVTVNKIPGSKFENEVCIGGCFSSRL